MRTGGRVPASRAIRSACRPAQLTRTSAVRSPDVVRTTVTVPFGANPSPPCPTAGRPHGPSTGGPASCRRRRSRRFRSTARGSPQWATCGSHSRVCSWPMRVAARPLATARSCRACSPATTIEFEPIPVPDGPSSCGSAVASAAAVTRRRTRSSPMVAGGVLSAAADGGGSIMIPLAEVEGEQRPQLLDLRR